MLLLYPSYNRRPLLGAILAALCCLYGLSVLSGCVTRAAAPFPAAAPPAAPRRAEEGLLDLSDWPFEERGPVALAGQWEFYWRQFLEPADFLRSPPPQPAGFIPVPGAWNGYPRNGQILPGDGYATYRLRVRIPPHLVAGRPGDARLALHMPWALTAYRLWLNGEPVAANGVVGTGVHDTTPQFLPVTLPFNSDSEWLELIVHVSNFSHRNGGLWNSPLLGTQQQLQHRDWARQTIDAALVGALLFIGTYHLAVARFLGPQPSSIRLGLMALVIALRTLVTSEHLLNRLAHGLPWEVSIRLEYLTGFASLPLLLGFLRSVFPAETSPAAALAARVVGGLGMAGTLILPIRLFSRAIPLCMVVSALFSLYIVGVFITAARRKREGARLLLVGGLALSFSGLHDLLHYNLLGLDIDLLPLGLFLLLACQALSLLEQFLKVFKREVALSAENARLLETVRRQLEAARESRRLLAQVDESLRRTIAERLHGRVQGRLLQTWHKLNVAKQTLLRDHQETQRLIDEARTAIDEVREVEIRQLSHLLHPSIVQLGLLPAMESLVREYRDAVEVVMDIDPRVQRYDQPGDNRIPEAIRLVAHRIMEEALSNVLAHAQATRVTLSLFLEGDSHLCLTITDDGRGFDPQVTQHRLGLRTMQARVASVDGEWDLRSGQGQGTQISVRLPLMEPEL